MALDGSQRPLGQISGVDGNCRLAAARTADYDMRSGLTHSLTTFASEEPEQLNCFHSVQSRQLDSGASRTVDSWVKRSRMTNQQKAGRTPDRCF
jgi:hypothetical protein